MDVLFGSVGESNYSLGQTRNYGYCYFDLDFCLNEYLFASILTNVKARTITTGLIEFVTVIGTNWGEMAAVSMVCLIPAVVFIGIAQQHIITGLTFGAVKD